MTHVTPVTSFYRNIVQIGPTAPTYSTLTQSVSPLVIGQAYTLRFYLSNSAASACSIVVTFGSMTLLSSTNAAIASWTQYNRTFTATAVTQVLTFAAYNSA